MSYWITCIFHCNRVCMILTLAAIHLCTFCTSLLRMTFLPPMFFCVYCIDDIVVLLSSCFSAVRIRATKKDFRNGNHLNAETIVYWALCFTCANDQRRVAASKFSCPIKTDENICFLSWQKERTEQIYSSTHNGWEFGKNVFHSVFLFSFLLFARVTLGIVNSLFRECSTDVCRVFFYILCNIYTFYSFFLNFLRYFSALYGMWIFLFLIIVRTS